MSKLKKNITLLVLILAGLASVIYSKNFLEETLKYAGMGLGVLFLGLACFLVTKFYPRMDVK